MALVSETIARAGEIGKCGGKYTSMSTHYRYRHRYSGRLVCLALTLVGGRRARM